MNAEIMPQYNFYDYFTGQKLRARSMYIPRTLVARQGTREAHYVTEPEIANLGRVVVLLGEPGIGKTAITSHLAELLGALHLNAGTFCRSRVTDTINLTPNRPIILDALDEIAASDAEPAIDRILSKLSTQSYPNVIISCRAADWMGTVNTAKFQNDYGTSPVPVHIRPLDVGQASRFLTQCSDQIDVQELLSEIERQGLSDLVGNPLTLKFLSDVWLQDGGLPRTKAELLDRATQILATEQNPIHDQSPHAKVSPSEILTAAGSMFAHMLLSGSVGITTNNQRKAENTFIPLADFVDDPKAINPAIATKTRLFKPDGEDQLIPVHRVIAEYLFARWLSERLDEKLSERRLFNLLHVSGGVPSTLRGLHAWLGYFSSNVRHRCIDADPYGFLRYAETSTLNVPSARHLLRALERLADVDPYFLSEDRTMRSVTGLGRPELKPEIIALITSPNRHIQLSALVLGSLTKSPLIDDLLPELVKLIKNTSVTHIERSTSATSLAQSQVPLDWPELIDQLLAQHNNDSSQIAVELIAGLGPTEFGADLVADSLIALNGLARSDQPRFAGSSFGLIRQIPCDLARAVLDRIASRIGEEPRDEDWQLSDGIAFDMEQLLLTAIGGSPIAPKRFWSWISHHNFGTGRAEANRIRNYLFSAPDFRHDLQRIVLYSGIVDNDPRMAIFRLQKPSYELNLSGNDAAFFLREIGRLDILTDYQVSLWRELVRATRLRAQTDRAIETARLLGVEKHKNLRKEYEAISREPLRDYAAEETSRRRVYEAQRDARHQMHRTEIEKVLPEIASGQNINALIDLALAYLGHYSDLPSDIPPDARLKEWMGDRIATSALAGFVATLYRSDLPSLEDIMSLRTKEKQFVIENVMVAGVSEVIRSGRPIATVPDVVIRAVLGIWWHMPEFLSKGLGKDIERALEGAVFASLQSTKTFLSAFIEPQLESGKQNISGLPRILHDIRFRPFSVDISEKWLRNFPSAPIEAQIKLIQHLMTHAVGTDLMDLIDVRIETLELLQDDYKKLWIAAAFCSSPSALVKTSKPDVAVSREMIWTIKDLLSSSDEHSNLSLPLDRFVRIVEQFAPDWPVVGITSSGRSHNDPWEACQFISSCIQVIGANSTPAATEALDHLCSQLSETGYISELRHVAHEQRRNRRDAEFTTPSFVQVKDILANLSPASVQDMQSLMVDLLDDVQQQIQNADTNGWSSFWEGDSPKSENACRDRLLDLLRLRSGPKVELLKELPMPQEKRVDIFALSEGQGLPIEVKGQWHPDLWIASRTQLDEKYCREWRTEGRGIYLVLWFGDSEKPLRSRPDGLPAPSNPTELQKMLTNDLGEGERLRIEVVVLDVSKPISTGASAGRKRARSKRNPPHYQDR